MTGPEHHVARSARRAAYDAVYGVPARGVRRQARRAGRRIEL